MEKLANNHSILRDNESFMVDAEPFYTGTAVVGSVSGRKWRLSSNFAVINL